MKGERIMNNILGVGLFVIPILIIVLSVAFS